MLVALKKYKLIDIILVTLIIMGSVLVFLTVIAPLRGE